MNTNSYASTALGLILLGLLLLVISEARAANQTPQQINCEELGMVMEMTEDGKHFFCILP